ncbi:MAG: hypothetical protein V3T01_12295 [Myxococcota bacterium]
MSSRERLVLLGAAVASMGLWLVVGTQATLPDLEGRARGWSGDFVNYYLPNAEYAGSRFARGELPLWNPHQGAGGPFLASLQVGALYPPNLLHGLVSAQTAFLVLAALHLGLAVILAGALAASLGAGPWGGALAGIAYASSLQVVGAIWSPPTHYAAAWAPGVLFTVDRVIARATARRIVAMAAAIAMSLLSGWPYTFVMSGLAAGLYSAVLLGARAVRSRRIPWAPGVALILGAIAGFMLAAPQMLPAVELVQRSCRALGSLVGAQAVFVDTPHDPSAFFASLRRDTFNDGVPGALCVPLALLALLLPGPGRGRVAAFLGIGVLALMTSFPGHLPFYGWLRELPLLGDFRFPYKYRLLLTLSLATAAGVGTARLQHLLWRWPRAALAAGVMAPLLVMATSALPVFQRVLPFARSAPEATSLEWELEGLEVADPGRRLDRIFWTGRTERLREWRDTYAVHDLEPLTLARSGQMITFFETGKPRTVFTPSPDAPTHGDRVVAPFSGLLWMPREGARAAILDLFSAQTIVSPTAHAWLLDRYRRISPAEVMPAVFDNPHALPRAYRVRHAYPEPPALVSGLRQLASGRFDPRRFAMLDKPPPELRLRAGGRLHGPSGEVEIVELAAERVVLRTRGDEPAAVVLTDAHYPGWVATVDGSPAPLLRANLNFRAVAVPPGEHEIVMRYRPASVRWGFAIALVAVVACVGGLLRSRRRR